MPTAVVELPARVDPPRKRWTRAECDVLCSSGIVDCQRLELIEGDVIVKERHDPPHMYVASMLYQWAWAAFGGDVVIPYAPINVAPEDNRFNAPEPDLIVLDRGIVHFTEDYPCPQNLRLVIEIAGASLNFDLTTKAALYARAGIIEYWVLDIIGRRMIVHRDPQGGCYLSVAAYSDEESVAPLSAPGSPFRIRDTFPV